MLQYGILYYIILHCVNIEKDINNISYSIIQYNTI